MVYKNMAQETHVRNYWLNFFNIPIDRWTEKDYS